VTTTSPELLVLPPIPLATGGVLEAADGVMRTITSVRLVITTEDGEDHRIPLHAEHGGWWPPGI
jgi:hypothetical protein